MKKEVEITENTPLLVLAGPMFFELFLNMLMQNIDTLMLSHYSENAVGAVRNANQVMNLLILMFGIIATATSVVVAQYLGAKRLEQMNMIYTLVLVANLVFGLILSGLIVLARRPCMQLLHVSNEMMPDALNYIKWVGGFLFLQAGYNVMLQILRCNGHTKVGFYISLAINGINIVGNYFFLYGPLKFLRLGVTVGYGAGILAGIGVAGIYMGTASDECIRGLILMHHWRSGKWRGKAIVEKAK